MVDMTTIGVTDIPEHEPVPRNNLNNHLKSSDFFDVEKFPTSEFQITNVKQITSDSLLDIRKFDFKRYYKKHRIWSKISREIILRQNLRLTDFNGILPTKEILQIKH